MGKNEKEWQEVRLGDICIINYGKGLIKSKVIKGHIPVYSSSGITNYHNNSLVNSKGIIIGRKGNAGSVFYSKVPFFCIDTTFYITENKNYDLNFLYYNLISLNLTNYITGTAVPGITRRDLYSINTKLPPLEEQKKIASILSSLDDKIELNNRMNKILEEMAQTIFKEWFVNFNFPSEDGKPYKDSGGKMIESELGAIPEGWRIGKLDEIIELFDNKRIPLSNIEREKKKKIYPYYGAASLMDYVDDYIFDGTYVLLGEDGTVIDLKGYPILQYVYGKFWVNNHAHVIKGKNGFNEESLFILLKNLNVRSIVTGAVQPKINQNNLKSLKIIIPDKNLILDYNKISKSIFNKIKFNQIENQKLASIRDTLLPKLMSGEIRVK
ncbi:restriction endonuclease subunit S [Brachyspira innocens]|uniref:restriction endonuclease subunit S n=1 Tax=Brachyspira innocens TaxID=13264 RepID=UPI00036F34BE|nr:restriction endonuclease subunit S [Brachyspira innocens]